MAHPFDAMGDEVAASPKNDDAEVIESPLDGAMKAARVRIAERKRKQEDETPIGGFNAAELVRMKMPDVEWIVRRVLQVDAVGIVGGEYKGCKSWLACALAVSISTGTHFLDTFHVDRRGWVLYIAFEDGAKNMRSRLRSIAVGQRHNPDDALARIQVIPRPRAIDVRTLDGQAWIVAQATAVEALAVAAGSRLELLVLDPFGAIHCAKNENDSAEMLPVMNALRVIRDTLSVSLVTPHHMGKPGAEGRGRGPQRIEHRLRGSTAIFQSADQWMLLENKSDDESERHRHWNVHLTAGTREGGGAHMLAELDVRLRDNGTAETAAWAPIPEEKEEGDASDDERVIEFLRAKDKPQSQNAIIRALKMSRNRAPGLLAKLVRLGSIEDGDRGYFIPPGKEEVDTN